MSGSSPVAGPGYEALYTGVAYRIAPDPSLVRIEGERARDVLNGLLSADLSILSPGRAVLSFVLTARGRPVALPVVLHTENEILLDVGRRTLDALLAHFAVYVSPRLAKVTAIEGTQRVSLLGPRWPEAAAAAGLDVDDWFDQPAPFQSVHTVEVADAGRAIAVTRSAADGGGIDLRLWPEAVERVTDALEGAVGNLGGVVASSGDYEIWRIERGIPVFGTDIGPDNLPQETGLEDRAVSFDKGCYTGQEVVARIHYRGHVNRRLRGLTATGPIAGPLPAPGTVLLAGDRPGATVTSTCLSPRFGPIAMAYVRREVTPADALKPSVGKGTTWRVSDLPFTLT